MNTSIIYQYQPDIEFINPIISEDQEISDNIISSPITGQFYGLLLPENSKTTPMTVSLFEVNRNEESIIQDESSTLNETESYQNVSEIDTSSLFQTKDFEKEIESNSSKTSTRTRWTKEEEEILIRLVSKAGARRWNQIASILKTKTAKQCRDHYANCLDPEIKNSLWTVEEEQILLEKYQEYGSHWSGIKKFLPGRTTSMIKNYVTMLLKKNEKGLSHEFVKRKSNNDDNSSSSCNNSNAGSDNDDSNFALNMSEAQKKYKSFNFMDIQCLLNPK